MDGSSTSWAAQSIHASTAAVSAKLLPMRPVSRRRPATNRAIACELKMTLPSGNSSRGSLPTGLLVAAARSVLTSTVTPLYSAAIKVANARKDASGACSL